MSLIFAKLLFKSHFIKHKMKIKGHHFMNKGPVIISGQIEGKI